MTGILFAFLLSTTPQQAHRDRAQFYRLIGQVNEGWTKDRVARQLGKPEAVKKAGDKGTLYHPGEEFWCYGMEPGGLPTLGYVAFKDDRVSSKFDHSFRPFRQVLPEARLRTLLGKLDSMKTERLYDPLWTIRAVNLLRPLGKTAALFVIEEYFMIGASSLGTDNELFWVMRALFDVPTPPGFMPRIVMGSFDLKAPAIEKDSPRFPIVMVGNVPFSVFTGTDHTGPGPSVTDDVDYFQDNCRLRDEPLSPPDDPFLAYEQVIRSTEIPPLQKGDSENLYRDMLLRQVLTLVRTAYQPKEMDHPWPYVMAKDFERFHVEFVGLGCRWDSLRQMYVRRDGSTITPRDRSLSGSQHGDGRDH